LEGISPEILLAHEKDGQMKDAFLVYAAKLLGAAAAIREKINRPVNFVDKDEYEQEMAEIRAELGEALFQSAWHDGQAMDLDQAVLLATEKVTPSTTLDP
jgi:hypothetical protein